METQTEQQTNDEFQIFKATTMAVSFLNGLMKFPRFHKNLKYNALHIYSYDTCIADIDLDLKTIKRVGLPYSRTTARHFNYAKQFLERFDFQETF